MVTNNRQMQTKLHTLLAITGATITGHVEKASMFN